MLSGIIGSVFVAFLFDRIGRFDLTRPTLYAVAMLAITVAIKWKFRRQLWFWIMVILLLALHSVLIVLIPWTTKWIPALVVIPFAIVDLYAMLAVITFVGNLIEKNRPVET